MNYMKLIEGINTNAGVNDWVINKLQNDDVDAIKQLIDFRIKDLLAEEFLETQEALRNEDAEELVDGLIDIVVIALGTLEMMDVDANTAMERVAYANTQKVPGVKPGRPNPLGLPDLVKPKGWSGPDHVDNHGLLDYIWPDPCDSCDGCGGCFL